MSDNALIRHDRLSVDGTHKIYLAQFGNPEGLPILYLHGGPGAGCYLEELKLFDLNRYRVLLLDQRGCGHSLPQGCLQDNNLTALLEDIEKVRQWLNIDSWYMAGGSFGATLGLIYSGLYPQRVKSQVYWGAFIPSKDAVQWLYGQQGAALEFPNEYRRFSQGIGVQASTVELFQLYHQGMHHQDPSVKQHFIHRWIKWEARLALPDRFLRFVDEQRAEDLAKTELHFALNDYFDAERLLAKVTPKIKAPTYLLQGENDWVCPYKFVKSYQHRFSNTQIKYHLVLGGNHSLDNQAMCHAVQQTLEDFVYRPS